MKCVSDGSDADLTFLLLPLKAFFSVYVLPEVLGDKSVKTFICVALRNGLSCDIKKLLW